MLCNPGKPPRSSQVLLCFGKQIIANPKALCTVRILLPCGPHSESAWPKSAGRGLRCKRPGLRSLAAKLLSRAILMLAKGIRDCYSFSDAHWILNCKAKQPDDPEARCCLLCLPHPGSSQCLEQAGEPRSASPDIAPKRGTAWHL